MTNRPLFASLATVLAGVLLAVGAAPAAADPTGTLTLGNGNNATLEFTADRSTDTITVTLGGSATLNGPVTPRGGEGSCNPTAANRFHCAFNTAIAASAKVLVDFATTQRMPDNAGGQFTICESPCTGSSHVHGPFVIQGPAATPGGDLHVDLKGPTAGFAGQDLSYTLTVANVGSATSAAGGVRIEPLTKSGADDATGFSGLPGGKDFALASVPALAPSGQQGSSASFKFTAGFDARPQFIITPLETLWSQPLGARTLVARLTGPSGDPAAPGLNEDRLVTTFTLRPQARRDSNIDVARADAIRGTASGNVARVEVAVVRVSGGARAARARCSWLTRRTRFRNRPSTRRRCLQPLWLRAKGTKRWRLRLRRRLPKGSYAIYSRAVPRAGVAENRFSGRDRNRLKRRVR